MAHYEVFALISENNTYLLEPISPFIHTIDSNTNSDHKQRIENVYIVENVNTMFNDIQNLVLKKVKDGWSVLEEIHFLEKSIRRIGATKDDPL